MTDLDPPADDDAGPIDRLLLRPLYSLGGVSAILRVPPSTLHAWTFRSGPHESGAGRPMPPLVTTVADTDGRSVPFLGLAEAHVLAALTRTGVTTRQMRTFLARRPPLLPPHHPLASERFVTRGPQVVHAEPDLVPLLDGAGPVDRPRFAAPVAHALGDITYRGGWAAAVVLSETAPAIVLDPRVNDGRPTVAGTQVDVNHVVVRLASAEPAEEIARDTGLAVADVLRLRD